MSLSVSHIIFLSVIQKQVQQLFTFTIVLSVFKISSRKCSRCQRYRNFFAVAIIQAVSIYCTCEVLELFLYHILYYHSHYYILYIHTIYFQHILIYISIYYKKSSRILLKAKIKAFHCYYYYRENESVSFFQYLQDIQENYRNQKEFIGIRK